MIDTITPKQQKYYDELIQKYIDNLTKPIDLPKATDAINRMWKSIGYAPPKVILSNNPLECVEAVKKYVKDNKIPGGNEIIKNVHSTLGAYWWRRYWLCYYEFSKYLGADIDEDVFSLYHDFLSEIFFIIAYDDVCFISESPVEIHFNNNDLHKEGAPALRFNCTTPETEFNFYVLNGIQVPQYLAETPAGNLDMEFFKHETNADVKAEFVRKFGIDRMISLGKVVGSYTKYSGTYFDNPHVKASEYKLIDMSPVFSKHRYAAYLYMKNQTTGIYHLEGVSPKCTNLPSALVCAEEGGKIVTNEQEALDILNSYDILDIK